MALLNRIYKEGASVQGVYNDTYTTSGKNLLSLKDAMSTITQYVGSIFEPALAVVTNSLVKLSKQAVDYYENNKAKFDRCRGYCFARCGCSHLWVFSQVAN